MVGVSITVLLHTFHIKEGGVDFEVPLSLTPVPNPVPASSTSYVHIQFTYLFTCRFQSLVESGRPGSCVPSEGLQTQDQESVSLLTSMVLSFQLVTRQWSVHDTGVCL